MRISAVLACVESSCAASCRNAVRRRGRICRELTLMARTRLGPTCRVPRGRARGAPLRTSPTQFSPRCAQCMCSATERGSRAPTCATRICPAASRRSRSRPAFRRGTRRPSPGRNAGRRCPTPRRFQQLHRSSATSSATAPASSRPSSVHGGFRAPAGRLSRFR